MKIRIKNDPCGMWQKGEIIDARELIDAYIGGLNAEDENDRECIEWLKNDSGAYAVTFCASVWEIEWEEVK